MNHETLRRSESNEKGSSAQLFDGDERVRRLLQQARASLKKSKREKAELCLLPAISADPARAQSYLLNAVYAQKADPQLASYLFFHGPREIPNDAKLLQSWV